MLSIEADALYKHRCFTSVNLHKVNFSTELAAVSDILGSDAAIAFESYLSKRKALNAKKPTLKDFKIDHDGLRGMKLEEQEKRRADFHTAQTAFNASIDALDDNYKNILADVKRINVLIRQFSAALERATDQFNDATSNLASDYRLTHSYPPAVPFNADPDAQFGGTSYVSRETSRVFSTLSMELLKDFIIRQFGFDREQVVYVNESYDDYGFERHITIKGKVAHIYIEYIFSMGEIGLECSLITTGTKVLGGQTLESKLIGGHRLAWFQNEYAQNVGQFISDHRYVLELEPDDESIVYIGEEHI